MPLAEQRRGRLRVDTAALNPDSPSVFAVLRTLSEEQNTIARQCGIPAVNQENYQKNATRMLHGRCIQNADYTRHGHYLRFCTNNMLTVIATR